MRIIIDVEGEFNKQNIREYLKCITIDDELIKSIKIERDED